MNEEFSQIFSTPPRILIVDNDEGSANIYKELLELWGYRPIVAKGNGQALLQDAKEKAKSHRCQLALVDLRLIDDLDDEDTSGLELAKQIKPTTTIIISGFGTIQLAVESIQNKTVTSFIIKGGPPESIFEEIKKITVKLCASKTSIEIKPQSVLNHIASILCDQVPIEYHDQIEDVFTRLFPRAKSLFLEIGRAHV